MYIYNFFKEKQFMHLFNIYIYVYIYFFGTVPIMMLTLFKINYVKTLFDSDLKKC